MLQFTLANSKYQSMRKICTLEILKIIEESVREVAVTRLRLSNTGNRMPHIYCMLFLDRYMPNYPLHHSMGRKGGLTQQKYSCECLLSYPGIPLPEAGADQVTKEKDTGRDVLRTYGLLPS